MILRRKIQILSVAVLHLGVLLQCKSVCLPILNCHSCPIALFACPIGVIAQFSTLHLVPFLALGAIGVLGVFVGRFFCGWICPFGLLQEVLYKIPGPKLQLPSRLRHLKYLVLVLLVVAIPFFFGEESPLFFCRLCPPATLQSSIPWAIIRGGFPDLSTAVTRLIILGAVIALVMMNKRAFCRALCPLGAIMSLFNKVSALSLRKDDRKCMNCHACESACPMDATPTAETEGGTRETSPECILCLECTEKCPTPDALTVSFLNSRAKGMDSSQLHK